MDKKRLYSPKRLKEVLEKHNFKLSKSLGQNFLIDGNIVRKIVEGAEINKEDYVLEVGPGMGTLTEELALNAKKVLAIEIDKKLKRVLDDTLVQYDNVEILFDDILKIDLEEVIKEKTGDKKIKVVANLPYYITTPIIAKFLEGNYNIDSINVMVQKEVADRITASPNNKNYGSLSIFAQFYSDPEIILNIPKTVFIPQPKVDSAVIRLKISNKFLDVDRDILFKLVRAAFSKRRKTILNSLSSGLDMEKDEIRLMLEECGIESNKRAENISLDEYIKLSNIMKESP